MSLKVGCLSYTVRKQPSIPLIDLERKWTLTWWWWWWWSFVYYFVIWFNSEVSRKQSRRDRSPEDGCTSAKEPVEWLPKHLYVCSSVRGDEQLDVGVRPRNYTQGWCDFLRRGYKRRDSRLTGFPRNGQRLLLSQQNCDDNGQHRLRSWELVHTSERWHWGE